MTMTTPEGGDRPGVAVLAPEPSDLSGLNMLMTEVARATALGVVEAVRPLLARTVDVDALRSNVLSEVDRQMANAPAVGQRPPAGPNTPPPVIAHVYGRV